VAIGVSGADLDESFRDPSQCEPLPGLRTGRAEWADGDGPWAGHKFSVAVLRPAPAVYPSAPRSVPPAFLGRLRRRRALIGLLAICGPGLVVMLADTDAGSLVTAAQSGARWGYSMVLPQLVLIPFLYAVQEITMRLGILTGKGHGALIRDHFGRGWALLSVGTLFVSATGALVTEFAGIAGVGEMVGIPKALTVSVATVLLVGVATTGSYRRLERVAILLGLAELALLPAVFICHPNGAALGRGLLHVPIANGSYLYLLGANVGAVIMPWMIFYQQGAVIEKGLSRRSIRAERQDTAVGAVITQLVMVMMVVAFAATLGSGHRGAGLADVGQIASVLRPYIGGTASRLSIGLAVLGAALVSAVVASLAGAWGLAEVFGWPHSLNDVPSRRTAKFYLAYALAHIVGAALVLASVDLIGLMVDVEVMNALLLPIVLGFLVLLEAKALSPDQRMHGTHRAVVTALCLAVIGFGIYMVPAVLLR
jgi:Mn2+/Fe2+ NRAMP family transporter